MYASSYTVPSLSVGIPLGVVNCAPNSQWPNLQGVGQWFREDVRAKDHSSVLLYTMGANGVTVVTTSIVYSVSILSVRRQ